MQQLLEIMAALRDPEKGCPWDREQTFESISRHTIEEAYEVADTIAHGDMMELKDELGDLLFQVVFYAQMAKEQGDFDFHDVEQAICTKMLRRHPHVFGDVTIGSAEEQTEAWEQLKADERKEKAGEEKHSQMDGVARALPALIRAEKLQKRAAKVGFDWPDRAGVIAKVREELDELERELDGAVSPERVDEEMGDLLFSCVNLARHLGMDAEHSLRGASSKFEERFRSMEQLMDEDGTDSHNLSLEEMDAVWERVKEREQRGS
ncbi:MAG: nucleoside triphosphate pyrophosphohydrolase [Candidatus Sedimenticola sp. PURPLELP]